MAENPLLPNKKLGELYVLTGRAEGLRSRAPQVPPIEALLAATLLHVEAGDFVSVPADARAAAALAPERTGGATGKTASAAALPPQRLASTVGVAQGMVHAGSDRFALLYEDAGPGLSRSEPTWEQSLGFAVQARLPLIVAVADVQGPVARGAEGLSWTSMSRLGRRTHLPVLSVDGTDAVAMYRAMQESVLRVRHGDGPVVLWCLLPGRTRAGGREVTPLEKLQGYLQARGIALPTAKASSSGRSKERRGLPG